ncbi:hypothetical protein CU097_013687 [Rhizopus azygosporus]|uniref:Uncharacterized protein n=1 Tax=Rhizopus azygosporus TaxID=86630 RepID=A0A367K724_RHIAZ|nr:hypothetical protein CU097_013687 [Rhizopus azygosporus]CEJ02224.1 hypothetical protein RMCBS344292_16236 [Rhizopus microsporus]
MTRHHLIHRLSRLFRDDGYLRKKKEKPSEKIEIESCSSCTLSTHHVSSITSTSIFEDEPHPKLCLAKQVKAILSGAIELADQELEEEDYF